MQPTRKQKYASLSLDIYYKLSDFLRHGCNVLEENWYISTKLHGITSQITVTPMLSASHNKNFTGPTREDKEL